jgi:3-deoxy-D-manno-octulosonate 8-phosphate phosphatase (KDO 8-P phosphatase)
VARGAQWCRVIDPDVAQRIRLVGFDVDGTMTDGGVYVGNLTTGSGEQGVELKRYDIQDGLAFVLLRLAGLTVVITSARGGEAARARAAELKVDEYVADKHKLPAFDAILQRRGVRWEEACYVGDDLPDLPLLRRAGLPVAVGNAVPEVKAAARFTTTAGGGRGAVREFVEAFLKARGTWADVVRTYLRERGDDGSR